MKQKLLKPSKIITNKLNISKKKKKREKVTWLAQSTGGHPPGWTKGQA